ncbi:MAG: hypothetical protein A4E53_04602 [Pelotomaculum sp. PtaB.Bin104]|nr:MAG: hypothetical protein A4E53_04602 [Pelotomaculum sp. PtaB.Bin104]
MQVARRVKSLVYHPSQRILEELADGSVEISFEVCGITEMKTWIVQWGDMVEVLEPRWLRDEMCQWPGEFWGFIQKIHKYAGILINLSNLLGNSIFKNFVFFP